MTWPKAVDTHQRGFRNARDEKRCDVFESLCHSSPQSHEQLLCTVAAPTTWMTRGAGARQGLAGRPTARFDGLFGASRE